MVTIRTSCPDCGEIELASSNLLLVVCTVIERSYYSYYCCQCGELCQKPADAEIIDLLVRASVPVQHVVIPQEALEAHQGDPIGYDDVLDFALRIRHVSYVAQVAEHHIQT
jgi:hypothetical protein